MCVCNNTLWLLTILLTVHADSLSTSTVLTILDSPTLLELGCQSSSTKITPQTLSTLAIMSWSRVGRDYSSLRGYIRAYPPTRPKHLQRHPIHLRFSCSSAEIRLFSRLRYTSYPALLAPQDVNFRFPRPLDFALRLFDWRSATSFARFVLP